MLTVLASCSSVSEPTSQTEKVSQQLHDIWALKTLNGEPVTVTSGQLPTLEINLTRNEIMGNDGCNEFSAPINTATGKNITFGPLQRTRMACPDRDLQARYTNGLGATGEYRLEQLNLFLLDADGKELMMFLKVD